MAYRELLSSPESAVSANAADEALRRAEARCATWHGESAMSYSSCSITELYKYNVI